MTHRIESLELWPLPDDELWELESRVSYSVKSIINDMLTPLDKACIITREIGTCTYATE